LVAFWYAKLNWKDFLMNSAVGKNPQKIYKPGPRVGVKLNPEAFHLFDGATGASLSA